MPPFALAIAFSLLFAAHLLCMNVAGAGPLVAGFLEWREGRGDSLAGKAGRFLAGASLVLFLLGMVLGLWYGWTKWSPEYRRALELIGSRVYFGVWELAFSGVLMAAHLLWWLAAPNTSPWKRAVRISLPILASTNLLYHFPFLFIVHARLLAAGDKTAEPLTSAEFRAQMLEGVVLARAVHFWLASFAASGIVLLCYSLLHRGSAASDETDKAARWGARLALAATLCQIPVGLWMLAQSSTAEQTILLGGDLLGTGLFAASIIGVVWLLHLLASISLGETRRAQRIAALAAFTVVVSLMTGALVRIGG